MILFAHLFYSLPLNKLLKWGTKQYSFKQPVVSGSCSVLLANIILFLKRPHYVYPCMPSTTAVFDTDSLNKCIKASTFKAARSSLEKCHYREFWVTDITYYDLQIPSMLKYLRNPQKVRYFCVTHSNNLSKLWPLQFAISTFSKKIWWHWYNFKVII